MGKMKEVFIRLDPEGTDGSEDICEKMMTTTLS